MNADAPLAAPLSSTASFGPPDDPAMDRVVAWLHEPARRLHGMIRQLPGFASLRYASLSVYDARHDMLWAFSCHSDGVGAPDVTEVEMTDVPSLVLLADSHEPRIVNDMAAFGTEGRFHTSGARNSDSRSSMTAPIILDGHFLGFVIFGASVPNFFTAPVCETLQTFTEAFGILIDRARALSD
ncbi:GAF domain-containing protein [Magnetospirillum sp. XM-1]|uniref:GAF domain-containing protein n=1 Tax=Magnetospirillum sp. XM-1 TaxID=1663591 RepID=UPI001E589642|nr:GAF domain-containing protein [Magnetospirillum sp. XM-1]